MLLLMMFLGSADVIGRYAFNRPITGTMEWSQMLMAGLVLLGLGYVQATQSHVRVDLIILRYPPPVKLIVELAILILTFVLLGFIAWQSTIIALADLKQHRLIETIYMPTFPFKLLVPFGASIACLECIIQMAHLFPSMKRKGVS